MPTIAQIKFKEKRAKRTKLFKEFMARAKSFPCVDCGVQYNPWVMEFDHLNPADKKYEFGKLHGKWVPWWKLTAEIAKCDVVCSNCHAERTYRQWQGTIKPFNKIEKEKPQLEFSV